MIYVVKQTGIGAVLEKKKYCPKGVFEKDTNYKLELKLLKRKYDSLSIVSGDVYRVGAVDSLYTDTARHVKGIDANGYNARGYKCKCEG
jgi:hypothetical protein